MAFFPKIKKIKYEGPDSKNPLSFKWYNEDEVVAGKTMKEHLRFSVVYWHTFRNPLSDPFGVGTAFRPWDDGSESVKNAQKRVHAAFEFIEKLGAPYYAFHDRDVAPEGKSLAASNKNLDAVAKVLKAEQRRTGIKLLWGTACLFANPRYMHGAATSCNADAFAYAAAQAKKAIEVTHQLGGEGFVFWGGREGYSTLWNTDMKRELDHLGAFLHMAVEHKKKIGFKGQFYIEPKPMEPTKHQYDSDAAACLNFLRQYKLMGHLKLNLETNHATLAGHEMQHELEVAIAANALGSIDANTGDPMLGWDTDQFPTSVYLTTECMLGILKMGGFKTGGVNFDAKVRRESYEPVDLFHAHIGGMDTFARGLKIAAAIRADGRLAEFVRNRYRSWDAGIGKKIESGKTSFKTLETYMLKKGEVTKNESGRQEFLENLINEFI
ncbi:MAG: xylose isomerase [Verrucomicrobiota bacterium]|jgi:xylose isomerase|nr:xylose isomerase [Verrucomicrobiota bacterium]MDP6252146.1 xylose isomerase [Verrucomicrobiota bacterium]MDP7292567.1 xylose isomerase [Verrucomicrobiota bacterium]MDP7440561.1 xylose isomerase [Verrucomicrobiota bacterium]HJN81613.1 xylose isomerase [Verrucomicrobiota bacterium]|tara:strand:+ start:4164 stop:5474 length:1311 start_codon:yes stop_codon:yes gene_type:complete